MAAVTILLGQINLSAFCQSTYTRIPATVIPILKLLDFDCEAAFMTYLNTDTVFICDSLTEFMLMLCVLAPLPDTFSSPFAQLLKSLFELLILFLFLLCRPLLPFRVERLWRAPLFPSKFLDLVPAIEHHVCEC